MLTFFPRLTFFSRLKLSLFALLVLGLMGGAVQAQVASYVPSQPADVGIPRAFPVRTFTGQTATQLEAACRTAINLAHAAGGGRVLFPDATIQLTSALPIYSNVWYEGVQPRLQYSSANNYSAAPDNVFAFTGGTVLKGDGTTTTAGTFDILAGNTAAGTVPVTVAEQSLALNGVHIENLGFTLCRSGIAAGAVNVQGLTYSVVKNCWMSYCAGWGAEFINPFHTQFDSITVVLSQNGIHFGGYEDTGNNNPSSIVLLAVGNSNAHKLYASGPNAGIGAGNPNFSRGIVVDARTDNNTGGVAGTTFGLHMDDIQCNCTHSVYTVPASSSTTTNGSASITVADISQFCVGLPVTVTTSTAGFTAIQTYFVISVTPTNTGVTSTTMGGSGTGAGSLTLANSRNGAAISASATSASFPLMTAGMPDFEAYGYKGANGAIALSLNSVTGLDLEGTTGADLYLENAGGGDYKIFGCTTRTTTPAVVARTSGNSLISSSNSYVNTDFDTVSAGGGTVFNGARNTLLSAGYNGSGLWNDTSLGIMTLSVGGAYNNGGDIQARGGILYPNTAIGERVYQANASQTLNGAQAGLNVSNSTGTAYTITLPVITTSPATSNNIGLEVDFINVSSTTAETINAGTGQTFNLVSGKVNYTLPLGGGALRCIAAQDTSGSKFWAAFPSNGAN